MTKPVRLFARGFPMRPFQETAWQSTPLRILFFARTLSANSFRSLRFNRAPSATRVCSSSSKSILKSDYSWFAPGQTSPRPGKKLPRTDCKTNLHYLDARFPGVRFGNIRAQECKSSSDLCDPHAPLLSERSTRSQQLRIRPNNFRLVYPEVICRARRRVLSTRTRDTSARDKSRNPNRLFAAIRR